MPCGISSEVEHDQQRASVMPRKLSVSTAAMKDVAVSPTEPYVSTAAMKDAGRPPSTDATDSAHVT
jgi:hypothetical protein